MIQVIVRTDASLEIGSGHVMRCITLAKLLKSKIGASVVFICRDFAGNLCSLIENNGFKVMRLSMASAKPKYCGSLKISDNQKDAWLDDAIQTTNAIQHSNFKPKLLIVDHYSLNESWESYMRKSISNIMVIDDLANRKHDCDLLLDQNYYSNMGIRYNRLVSQHCQQFIGPEYLLLREEFHDAQGVHSKKPGSINRILMFFGGSDQTHETIKAIESLESINNKKLLIDVIVGHANLEKDKIKKICSSMAYVKYHCQINNMAELMFKADLAVIAAGCAIWEAFVLGLPAITIMTAKNQIEAISALGEAGMIKNLGWHSDVSSTDIAKAINDASFNVSAINEMSMRAFNLMGKFDGHDRLVATIKTICA